MSAASKDEFLRFYGLCVQLRSSAAHHNILFGLSEAQRSRLWGIAGIFFSDLHGLLRDQIIQYVCKLTDPAISGSKRNPHINLTIKHFLANCDFANDLARRDQLVALSVAIHLFADKIRPARDKLISHSDHAAIMAELPIGAAPQVEWDEFWSNLSEFAYQLGCHFGDTSFRLFEVGMISDADNVLRDLRKAAAFDLMVQESELSRRCLDAFDSVSF